MPLLFSSSAAGGQKSNAGVAGLVDLHNGDSAFIFVGSGSSALQLFGSGGSNVILLDAPIQEQASAQFHHMLGGDIYLYTFGRKIGTVRVSGLCLISCQLRDSIGTNSIRYVADYFDRNSVAAKKEAIKLYVGGVVRQGYLLSLSARLVNPELRIAQFELTFASVPRDDRVRGLTPGAAPKDNGPAAQAESSIQKATPTASSTTGTT